MVIKGVIVDILNRRQFKGAIEILGEKISKIYEEDHDEKGFIVPGFIDAHVHIESSMLVPSQFAKIAVTHGTVATVSDPHEIANVLGLEGVKYMIEEGKKVPLKFFFGAPSCVPATTFETAGATINSDGIKELLSHKDIYYLAEMMNYPGVIFKDEDIHKKLQYAKEFNKKIDGHAPGVTGEDLKTYIEAGISTDHECFTTQEALEKLSLGMKILIREGSAAKNFNALSALIDYYYEHLMFCSDDKHPDDLLEGHINQLCARSVAQGEDIYKVLQMACINPVDHYNLNVGKLQVGDSADFVVLEDLKTFKTVKTYIEGELVFENNRINFTSDHPTILNNFSCSYKQPRDFDTLAYNSTSKVIVAKDGELITTKEVFSLPRNGHSLECDLENDILKIAVINRYKDAPISTGFIKNFGLKKGAIASSVAHDSHNIIAVGANPDDMCEAVNAIISEKGGIAVAEKGKIDLLPLPIGGIMSNKPCKEVAKKYSQLDKLAKNLGSKLTSPFMTLSFMGLLVIPSLKLSDLGLFDGEKFEFTPLHHP
ncbi:adenine deaminase [Aegicerativicinus sediminis]